MNQKQVFIKSFLAGICISIGCVVYLTIENHVVGAFLFSIGLLTIYSFGFYLYTGKVCDISLQKPSYLLTVLIVYLGNMAGCVSMGWMLPYTKLSKLVEHTKNIVGEKLSDTAFSIFIMAFLCGLLMCIAVKGFSMVSDGVGKYFILILPIMVFILSGYEHSIANLFYFTMAGAWNAKAVLYIVIISLGNLFGGCFIPFAKRIALEDN